MGITGSEFSKNKEKKRSFKEALGIISFNKSDKTKEPLGKRLDIQAIKNNG